MRKLVLFAIISVIVSSCATAQVGRSKALIGEVIVSSELPRIGETLQDVLQVSADDNGNACVTAGKGSDLVHLYLSDTSRSEYMAQLRKLSEWGAIAAREKIETKKYVGGVSTSTGYFGQNVLVQTTFLSFPDGREWVGLMNHCEMQSPGMLVLEGNKTRNSASPCVRELSFYLSPVSVDGLQTLLSRTGEYSGKAAASKAKSELLR